MSSQAVFLLPSDPNRFLPSSEQIENIKKEDEGSKFTKLQRILSAVSERQFSGLFPDEAKERCISLIPLCYEGINKQKLNPQLVLKVIGKFETCGVFQSDKWKEEVVFCANDQKKVLFNGLLLRINSSVFTNLLTDCGDAKEIPFSEYSFQTLCNFKYYILHQDLPRHLTLEELVPLHEMGHRYDIKSLCSRCVDHMEGATYTEKAIEHADTLYQFIRLSGVEGLEEKKKKLFVKKYVTTVLEQNEVPYVTASNDKIGIPIAHAYLLGRENSFASLLQLCVTGVLFKTATDQECFGELMTLEPKVRELISWIDIGSSISCESIQKLSDTLTHVSNVFLSVQFSDARRVLEAIADIKGLKDLHLKVPCLQKVEEEQPPAVKSPYSGFSGAFNGVMPFGDPRITLQNVIKRTPEFEAIYGPLLPKMVPNLVYSGDEVLYINSKIVGLLKQLSKLTVDNKCVLALSKDCGVEEIAGYLKGAFSSTIVKIPRNYSNLIILEPASNKKSA